jgi:uncharacterized membrane protein YfcA
LLYIFAGASVGFIVGITGIGGGALMTPLLMLFGFPAPVAVGTDLMYAGLTKAGGVISHHRHKTIQWKLAGLLAAGSLPAALITGYFLDSAFTHSDSYESLLSNTLGIMLILTATVLFSRSALTRYKTKQKQVLAPEINSANKNMLTNSRAIISIILGAILGVLVTLSSVGAGAIGTAILLMLYPALKSKEVVGTDIAHAVPLTLIGGFVHMNLGNVDFLLLGSLLIGSLPAIHLGSKVSTKLPDNILQPLLACLLLGLGIKYAFF